MPRGATTCPNCSRAVRAVPGTGPAHVPRVAILQECCVARALPACNAGCCVDQAEQLLMSSVNAMRKNGDAAKQPPQLKEKEIGPPLHRIVPAVHINFKYPPRDRGGPFLSRAGHAKARAHAADAGCRFVRLPVRLIALPLS